jgi:hypothetical protein
MAAVAPSCTSVYVAAATAPAPDVACGRAEEGCCRHLTLKRVSSDGVWLSMLSRQAQDVHKIESKQFIFKITRQSQS